MVLVLCMHPMLVNIYMKLHEDILNSFQVIERTRFCDGRMDRQMDALADRWTTLTKTIRLPTLKGGDIISAVPI